MRYIIFFSLIFLLGSCKNKQEKNNHQLIETYSVIEQPKIDGVANDICWQKNNWQPLDQKWLGEDYTSEDFSGRYKVSWDENKLYLLVEIEDDTLFDQYKDPLKLWWDDDCVEVFVDEDNSGGNHQFTHNAFAYHVALDGNVVDLGPDEAPHLYNDHVVSAFKTTGTTSVWELAISVYNDSYEDGSKNIPVKLKKGKNIGFALAYCDNDKSKERENFIGSVYVPGEDKNQGWINADIFGTLNLKE